MNNDLTHVFDNNFTFDQNLATFGNHLYPEDYEKNEETQNKNIRFIQNKPVCFNKRLKKDIKFIALHFQGRNKRLMKDYYLN